MAFTRPEWVSHTVSVEDMTAGKNQWRNIQDIVRVTFKEFHDVLRAQGDAINPLERGRLILRPTGASWGAVCPGPSCRRWRPRCVSSSTSPRHRTPARLEGHQG